MWQPLAVMSRDDCLDVAPVYELFAVLIHRGQSASSGHYIAVIKDPVTGNTYNFNDTEVKKEKKFNLANEEEGGRFCCRCSCAVFNCIYI